MSELCGSTDTTTGKPCRQSVSEGRCWRHPDGASLFPEIQHPQKRAFLAAYIGVGGNITRASEVAEIDRSTFYSEPWQRDMQLQAALKRAKPLAAKALVSEAIRRAFEGVSKPYVHGGSVARDEHGDPIYLREYSDTLMIFLLKNLAGFRDQADHRHELSGPGGGPIELRELTDDELATRAQQLTNRLQAVRGNGRAR